MNDAAGTRGHDPIESLLRGTWTDPDGGGRVGVPVEAIVVERSLRGHEADLVAQRRLGRRVAVVCDPDSRRALGERIERALSGTFEVVPVTFPDAPRADLPAVATLRAASVGADALIAVGSGTINDVTKYAAAQDGKPYLVFGTAPSMNGYTSTNAAITVDGHKQTLPAVAPRGVYLDLEVLAAAPPRLIRAGIGDSLCRATAQADWRLSHLVRGTAYRDAPFALLADEEPGWMDRPEDLLRGDLDAMRALARTLVLSGLGMTICQGSYPASQGEHLIGHYIEMFAPAARPPSLHGEQVAVATLAMARLQQRMLAGPPPALHPTDVDEAALAQRFGDEVGRSCWRAFAPKALDDAAARDATAAIRAKWPAIVADVGQIAPDPARIESVLRRAGAPTAPSMIGVGDDFFATAVRNARFLRDRYTFLDLAGDARLL
ncbi:MAG: sn-glycerol-1-phosphate dehydrogenase [Burkholderiales bacterium]